MDNRRNSFGPKSKIYLDLCVYSRPFDDQSHSRIALETNAFIYLLDRIENTQYAVINSEMLKYENSRDPDPVRKERVSSYLGLAKEFVKIDEEAINRAIYLRGLNFDDLDALHLALADGGGAAFFLTCDDSIVRKAENHEEKLKTKVMNILKFVAEEAI